MAAKVVTIEGSLTPAAGLPGRGERKTVQHTDRIDRLVEKGYIVIVETFDGAPEPDEDQDDEQDDQADDSSRDESAPPKANASRVDWAEFLTSQGVSFPDDEGGEWASRDDLIIIWQQASGGA